MINLQVGAVYPSKRNGLLEYVRIDNFMGQSSFQFRRLSDRQMVYVGLDDLDNWLEPQETIETVRQQRDELSQALSILRESFVIAAGDKSPFAKCALAQADAAIAKAKGGEV